MTVLSIGMIVKNEEKMLRRTLEALQPLRDAVDCQLIIADTGSNDGTIAIAQEFADTFLQIEWENDFAKARNTTLAKARGEWFFYLDADEVLNEPEELIDFLGKAKKRKRYYSVSIKLQNLTSEAGDRWTSFTSERFFRVERGQWFVGAIHENYPKKAPVYELKQSYLCHYGYNYDDKAFMQHKGERNVAIIEANLPQEDVPGNVVDAKKWIDYADSLTLVEHREEDVIKAIHHARDLLTPLETDDDLRIVMLARGYSIMLRAIFYQLRYEDCVSMAEEYFEIQPIRGVWDMDVCHIHGWAQMRLRQYQASIDSLERYLEIAAQPKSREVTRLIIFSTEGLENNAYFALAQNYTELRDYDRAWEYLAKIDGAVEGGVDITAYRWQLALDNDSEHRLPKVYAELDEAHKATILLSLADAICKKDGDRQQDIAAGLRQIVADDEENLLPLLALATGDKEELRGCLRQMKDNVFSTAQGGIIRQCLKWRIPMNELIPHLDKDRLAEYIATCQAYYIDWINWATMYYDAFKIEEMTLLELWMARQLLGIAVGEECFDANMRLLILPMLLRHAGEYLQQVYQPIMFTEQRELLPAVEQFVIFVQQAEDALNQQNYAEAVQALRDGLRVYPSAQAVIELKLAAIETVIDPVGTEMKRLAQQVKEQIRSLIENEQLDEAEILIDELSAIVPDDPDIPFLLEQTRPTYTVWN